MNRILRSLAMTFVIAAGLALWGFLLRSALGQWPGAGGVPLAVQYPPAPTASPAGLPCESVAWAPFPAYSQDSSVQPLPCWILDLVDAANGGDGWGWEYAWLVLDPDPGASIAAVLGALSPYAPDSVRRVVRDAVVDALNDYLLSAWPGGTPLPDRFRDRGSAYTLFVDWLPGVRPAWTVIPWLPRWAHLELEAAQ